MLLVWEIVLIHLATIVLAFVVSLAHGNRRM